MAKYRKKPVVIEAFQTGSSDAPDWALEALDKGTLYYGEGDGLLRVRTLEGEHLASAGDWIIRGVKGELYPCKPDIFTATYEPVREGGE